MFQTEEGDKIKMGGVCVCVSVCVGRVSERAS